MNQQANDTGGPGHAGTRRNRWIASGIMLLPVVVVVVATALWWANQRGYIDLVGALGTHNHGRLIHPVQDFKQLTLLDGEGREFFYAEQMPKWTLVLIGDAYCADSCRESLWLSRQLHAALGRRAQYLRRFYLSDTLPLSEELARLIASEHPRLQVLQADEVDLRSLENLAQAQGRRAAFFLVDKQGYLMMYYTPDNSGKDIIADLKFLMKQTGDD